MIESKLEEGALYAQWNGMVLCGTHSGMTARATGKCLDGHPVEKITDEWVKDEGGDDEWVCEQCGAGRVAEGVKKGAKR